MFSERLFVKKIHEVYMKIHGFFITVIMVTQKEQEKNVEVEGNVENREVYKFG